MQVVEVNDQLVMLKVSGRLHFFCFTSIIPPSSRLLWRCASGGELSASFSGDPHYGVRHCTETQPTSWYFSDQRSKYKQRDCYKLL